MIIWLSVSTYFHKLGTTLIIMRGWSTVLVHLEIRKQGMAETQFSQRSASSRARSDAKTYHDKKKKKQEWKKEKKMSKKWRGRRWEKKTKKEEERKKEKDQQKQTLQILDGFPRKRATTDGTPEIKQRQNRPPVRRRSNKSGNGGRRRRRRRLGGRSVSADGSCRVSCRLAAYSFPASSDIDANSRFRFSFLVASVRSFSARFPTMARFNLKWTHNFLWHNMN